jgi:hypothetical protein
LWECAPLLVVIMNPHFFVVISVFTDKEWLFLPLLVFGFWFAVGARNHQLVRARGPNSHQYSFYWSQRARSLACLSLIYPIRLVPCGFAIIRAFCCNRASALLIMWPAKRYLLVFLMLHLELEIVSVWTSFYISENMLSSHVNYDIC